MYFFILIVVTKLFSVEILSIYTSINITQKCLETPPVAVGVGSIPGQGAKIPHALRPKTKTKTKQKTYCNKFNKDFKNHAHQKILKKKKKKKKPVSPQPGEVIQNFLLFANQVNSIISYFVCIYFYYEWSWTTLQMPKNHLNFLICGWCTYILCQIFCWIGGSFLINL